MKNWTSQDIERLQAKNFKEVVTGEAAAAKPCAKPSKQKAKTSQLSGAAAIEARLSAVYLVGIDPGTKTGLAVKYRGKFISIETTRIYNAIKVFQAYAKTGHTVFVRIEDARLRTYFGKTDREKLQGAGSIKRDCAIWEEVLNELQIPFEFVHPKNAKATTAEMFKKFTGWEGRTSIHAREAASLIW